MLTEISIRNFAIIDSVSLPFVAGFNVLTGETGAGKSIILDAVLLILGGRADKSMVRANCKAAFIEATFSLSANLQASVNPILEAEGLDGEFPDEILVGREIRANGRSLARVNGRTVSVAILQQIGAYLVDIHGQGSHLGLLQPKSHLPLLDSYANLNVARRHLAEKVTHLRGLQRELTTLQQDEREIAQRIDLLKFQVEEIDAADLGLDEEDGLQSERKRLGNAEQLMRFSAETSALLLGVDDETPSASDLLSQAERALTQMTTLDDSQNELLTKLQGLSFELNEVAAQVSDYQDSLEFNPERLREVEERIDVINGLKRKYGDTIEAVLDHRDEAAAQLNTFERSGERTEELELEIDRSLRVIGKLSAELSQKRRESAEKLSEAVTHQLGHLRMKARFGVDFQQVADASGAYVGDQRLAFDATGVDKVEFLISTNPGEPLKPMAKVASGGETARLMLALKTALAQVDQTPTLIFDEIDQGIGGRIGETVGRKLWGLTSIGEHQVIVVTHLPQLAGFGDRHFHVSKHEVEGRTKTRVGELQFEQRVSELAAMIGTDDVHAIGGATSILENAEAVKKQQALSPT